MRLNRVAAALAALGLIHGTVIASLVCATPAGIVGAHAGHADAASAMVHGGAVAMDHAPATPEHGTPAHHERPGQADCCRAMASCSGEMACGAAVAASPPHPVGPPITGVAQRVARSPLVAPDPPPPKA
ncbi:MAG TPA: hypothetical protein VG916_10165 [Gemmatimonadaceae bacterium]|nr:hypothetical protein [Gemmatimonadaceae bacterium]